VCVCVCVCFHVKSLLCEWVEQTKVLFFEGFFGGFTLICKISNVAFGLSSLTSAHEIRDKKNTQKSSIN